MNAQVKVNVTVNSRKRGTDRWRETTSVVEAFHLVTDLDHSASTVPPLCTTVYNYQQAQVAAGYLENFTHAQIRLDNPTHPTPAAGVVPLAKGHRDLAIANGEFTSSTVLEKEITTAIADLKQRAKY